jgi:hypothetical protein
MAIAIIGKRMYNLNKRSSFKGLCITTGGVYEKKENNDPDNYSAAVSGGSDICEQR